MAKPIRIIRPLSKAELLEVAVIIESRIMEGDSREEIMERLNYTHEQYDEAKRFLLDSKSEELRDKPREHQYVEYVIEQRGTIKQLDKLVTDLEGKSQYNAIVGALRLRTDLVDRIVDKGVDFGFIKKTPERKEIIAGVLIGDMSTPDLKKAIMDHGKLTKDLLSKFGEGSFLELPEKPTHYSDDEAIEVEAEEDDEEDLDAELKRKSKETALAPKKHKIPAKPKK